MSAQGVAAHTLALPWLPWLPITLMPNYSFVAVSNLLQDAFKATSLLHFGRLRDAQVQQTSLTF